ncbi:hypothetical protein VSS74_03885 [Conexibacter stalactiti]|uniref:Uncharacterized protein n=1 Tax=Conexibacter stalactiti TaxID=1940611 RepID=A0ABU4HJG3_9ACTN|nr:hypothetical protein [Conexibacter stalactiti]MDW5593463.1 hypothetical protein [Conexibacter stalactiti]MEC5034104.1 hypothetical protein [Conexibacter stalactiti]
MRLHIQIDRRVAAVARTLRVHYPRGLDLIGSGLGLAECRLERTTFAEVFIANPHRLGGCPQNAVIATGTVVGEVRLDPLTIGEVGTFTLMTGPFGDDGLELVGLVEGINPFGALLAYQGELREAGGRYGGTIEMRLPWIPILPYDTADVALLDIEATIGSTDIIYAREGVRGVVQRWRPEGPRLPTKCASGGMPFEVEIDFSDGSRTRARAKARCPLPSR